MRVLFVAPFGACQKQTLPRRMLPLARALAAAGLTVEVLVPAWDCPGEAGRLFTDQGVTVRVPALGPTFHPLLDVALLRRLLQAAKDFRPDIVHVFKGLGYAGWVGGRFLRRGRATVVVDVDDLETLAGWGAQRSHLLARWAIRQERSLLGHAHGVTAASADLVVHVDAVRNGRDDALYLPNGLDLAPQPAPVAANPAVVLLYTRGNDVDASRVSELWLRILTQTPEARLHVVGDWKEAPDLPHCVRMGWLEGESLIASLRGAAVALFPVKDNAATRAKSPARLLDCLAQGLPVVVERVGEYGSLAGAAGRVIAAGDDDGLVAAVTSLLRSSAARQAAGEAAWQQAQHHTWAVRADSLMAFYERFRLTPFGLEPSRTKPGG